MSEKLSNQAIIYAILALNSEITLQKEYLNSTEIEKNEIDNEADILSDLDQAFAEFIDFYKVRCKRDKKLPSIDELLNNSL